MRSRRRRRSARGRRGRRPDGSRPRRPRVELLGMGGREDPIEDHVGHAVEAGEAECQGVPEVEARLIAGAPVGLRTGALVALASGRRHQPGRRHRIPLRGSLPGRGRGRHELDRHLGEDVGREPPLEVAADRSRPLPCQTAIVGARAGRHLDRDVSARVLANRLDEAIHRGDVLTPDAIGAALEHHRRERRPQSAAHLRLRQLHAEVQLLHQALRESNDARVLGREHRADRERRRIHLEDEMRPRRASPPSTSAM